MGNVAVILAGGKGSRMKQNGNKVLLKICGKPLISYIIDVLKQKNIEIFVVIGKNSEIPSVLGDCVNYVLQDEPLGTGHALMQVVKIINGRDVNVLVINGDGPILDKNLLEEMLNLNDCDMKILVDNCQTEHKFGRILRDENNEICDIIETKDCSPEQLKITEVNLGLYCIKNQFLIGNIAKISRNNAQNEYYITDLINLIYKDAGVIKGVNAQNFDILLSVNTLEELDELDSLMQQKIQQNFVKNGVRFVGNSYIDAQTKIGKFSVVQPFCTIFNSVIGQSCEIGAHCVIENSVILDGLKIGAGAVLCNVEITENVENSTKLIKKP